MNRCVWDRRAGGFSLVETLVALLLGTVLSAALVAAYLAAKRHNTYIRELARLQENASYASQLLTREIAMAGFFGGLAEVSALSAVAVGGDCGAAPWALDPAAALGLVNDHVGTGPPVGIDGHAFTCIDGREVAPRTDLLAVKRSVAAPSLLRGRAAPDLSTDAVSRWFLYLRAGEEPAWRRLAPRDLEGLADMQDSYWEASARVFFIRRYSTTPGDGVPTLCMETLAGNRMLARCLVEGVEAMQFEVGVDDDGDGVANRYLAAPSAADMANGVTVRVALLLRTIAPVQGFRGVLDYALPGGVLVSGRDAFPRRLVSTTARLRNLPAWPAPATVP